MGCYGIGVGRTVAAAIEQNHDENGIIFPRPIAPFECVISVVDVTDEAMMSAGERLYGDLLESGFDVLLDDRRERPGVKFKDADLTGIPLRITIGRRIKEEGRVELKLRTQGKGGATSPLLDDAAAEAAVIFKAMDHMGSALK